MVDEIALFFRKLHGNEEQRQFTIDWLAKCMDGDLSRNKFKMNIGYSAENGKSTEFAIHSTVFDIYSQKLSAKFFALDNSKKHKEQIDLMLYPIRFAYIEELRTSKLDVDFMKESCDGRMECEVMYGTSIRGNIQATFNTCSNKDANTDVDKGILRRGLVQYYKSEFKQGTTEDNYEKNSYIPDLHFKDKFNNPKMKNAYFHFLNNHYKHKIHIPQENIDGFKEVSLEVDAFYQVLDELVVKTNDEKDRIHRDDLKEALVGRGCGVTAWNVILSKLKSIGFEYRRQARINNRQGCFINIKFK